MNEGLLGYAGVLQRATFGYTGGEQTWLVPIDVTKVWCECRGGAGGKGNTGNTGVGGIGGQGAIVTGFIYTTPGETLYIYVGGIGGVPTGGYNGGAAGGSTSTGGDGGGGGGATDIRQGGNAVANRVIVAGGGGGGGGGSSAGSQPGGVGGNGGIPDAFNGTIGGGADNNALAIGGNVRAVGSRVNVGSGETGGVGSSGVTAAGDSGGGGGGLFGGGGGGSVSNNRGGAGGGGGSSMLGSQGSAVLPTQYGPTYAIIMWMPGNPNFRAP